MKLQSCLLLLLGRSYSVHSFAPTVLDRAIMMPTVCFGKKDSDDSKASVSQQKTFAVGTFVEFEEKKREHIGKIDLCEHKTNGGARYQVTDSNGKHYAIPDKAVHFAITAPNTPGQATKLFDDFCDAHKASLDDLQVQLDITPDLLQLAWEETAEENLTANGLVELVHSHTASKLEQYMAWKLLRTDMAHIFFKEIKDHGRVVAFKAKTRKAVDAAKQTFCSSHPSEEVCFV